MSTLGERITEARTNKGWTAKELAEHLNVSPQTVHRYETGEQFPRSSMLTTIAIECEVNREWLVDGFGDKYADHKVARRVDKEHILTSLTDRDKEVLLRFINLDGSDRRNIRYRVEKWIDKIEERKKEEGC